jgi:hypothetical protein
MANAASIVVVNEIPNSPAVVLHVFGTGERFSDEATTPLAQGIVEPLDQAGLAAAFLHWLMALRGEDARIRAPEVRIADRALALGWRQRPPQPGSAHVIA